jgi:hypothetical protein
MIIRKISYKYIRKLQLKKIVLFHTKMNMRIPVWKRWNSHVLIAANTRQVTDKLKPYTRQVSQVVMVIGNHEYSIKEILDVLHLKDRENFMNHYLTPAIHEGLVTMLYPDSPRHPRQKYHLTVKGLHLYHSKN